jgi:hypothetical protein
MTRAGGLRGLGSSLLKSSASTKKVEAEIKNVSPSLNLDLGLSLFGFAASNSLDRLSAPSPNGK